MANRCWWLIDPESVVPPIPLEAFPTVIGRDGTCDVTIDDPSVSGIHLQLNLEGKELVLHDLGSSNGTFVNGRYAKTAKIKPKAGPVSLKIGHVLYNLRYGTAASIGVEALPEPEPTGDDDLQWYFASDGQEVGPLSSDEMFAAVEKGQLKPTDDVWRSDISFRTKAYEVKGLFSDAASDSSVGYGGDATDLGAPAIGQGMHTCPYCWHRFRPEDVLFIACHPDLVGDDVVGREEAQRFLPSRFTPDGLAVDARGVACPDMACPRCHLRIPQTLLHMPPLFVSIVGAPSSGKSYFLASMNWRLRTTLPKQFAIRYMDIDATTNRWLNEYEERLFLQADESAWQMIAKTQERDATLYRTVNLDGMQGVALPQPCMFSLQSEEDEASQPVLSSNVARSLILYDNAGEHYQPGKDSSMDPGTRHLLCAEGLIFLFDPTKDPRFRKLVRSADIQLTRNELVQRQDVLLIEMMGRIRRHLGLATNARYSKPIIIAVSKADVLEGLLELESLPWVGDPVTGRQVLDLQRIAEVSYLTRTLIAEHAPEIVSAVESFAEHVVYLPNSALGHSPSANGASLVVRPCDVKPRWVEVPLLYILSVLGYVPTCARLPNDVAISESYRISGKSISLSFPSHAVTVSVPTFYSGFCLKCPKTGLRFMVPEVEAGCRLGPQ